MSGRRSGPLWQGAAVVLALAVAACSGTTGSSQTPSGATRSATPSADSTVGITVAGNGRVYATDVTDPCATSCSAPLAAAGVTLTAAPDKGWSLEQWDGPCAPATLTIASCTVKSGSSGTVTARFTPDVSLTVAVTGSGAVTSNALSAPCTQTCTVTGAKGSAVLLQPQGTSKPPRWSSCAIVSGNTCIAVLGDAAKVSADFAATGARPTAPVANGVPVKARIDEGMGVVLGDAGPSGVAGAFIDCPKFACAVTAPTGIDMTFVAAPGPDGFGSGDTEWMFARWSGACAARPGRSVCQTAPIDGPTEVGASFVRRPRLIVKVIGVGTVTEPLIDRPTPDLGPYSFGDTKPINCPTVCERRVRGRNDVAFLHVANTGNASWDGCDWAETNDCSVSRFLDDNGQPVDRVVTVTFGSQPTIRFKGTYKVENVWGSDPTPEFRNERETVDWDVAVTATLEQLAGAPPMIGAITGHIRRLSPQADHTCEADFKPPPGGGQIRPQGGSLNNGTAKFTLTFPLTREYLVGPKEDACSAPQNIATHPPPNYNVSKLEQVQITIDLNGPLIQTFPLDTSYTYQTTSAGRTVQSSALVTGFVTVTGLGKKGD